MNNPLNGVYKQRLNKQLQQQTQIKTTTITVNPQGKKTSDDNSVTGTINGWFKSLKDAIHR